MAPKQKQLTAFTISENKTNNSDFGAVIKKYIYHWPLYIIGLGLFIALGYLYLYIVQPVYNVNTSVLIKDDKRKFEQQPTALHEIELTNSAKIIENEIEVIKSKKNITSVITDLQLWVNYIKKDGLRSTDLYKESPVKFVLIRKDANFKDDHLSIEILDDKSFNFKNEAGKDVKFEFNKTYVSGFGAWKLEPTANISKFLSNRIKIDLYEIDDVAIDYQKELVSTLPNKAATAVILSVEDVIPNRGKDFLNHLIINYNLQSTGDKIKDSKITLEFLDQKIAELSKELGTAEKGIAGYKSSRGLTDINMQSQVSLQNLQSNDNKLNDINIQLNIINEVDRYVNSAQNSDKVPSINGISDIALSSSIEKLSQLQLQYEQLAAVTPETSPEFEPINRQIRAAKATIKEGVRNIKASLQTTKNKLLSYNANFESSIRSLPGQEREYIDIKRQQSSKEGLYTYYLQKREELAARYASTLADEKVIDHAYSGEPINPKKGFIYAVSILLGLILPTTIVFARNSFNTSILNIDDVKEKLNIPIVAHLPYEYNGSEIIINDKFATATSEQFRALRTKLYYLHGEKESGRVTLVTSSIPGEGKSFVSINLSAALAFTGRKTVVLELDMRKPKVGKSFNLEAGKLGLSDYFMGKAKLNEIVQQTELMPNLHIITAGTDMGSVSELLERKELKTLIATLKEIYDDIVIDTPPAHLVPDATIVSPNADVCLYVVRQGFTDKAELNFVNELIEQKQLENVNIVFNGMDKKRHGYGYVYDTSYYHKPQKASFKANMKSFANRF
jgi:tyrosine-protein kinase Etk/Wzc